MHRSLALALLITSTAAGAVPCPRGTFTGEVTDVGDGDTIEVGRLPIRLNGMAAPEWDEPDGVAATRAMVALVDGRTLRCELNGEHAGDRCVGICFLDGKDIAAGMVAAGLARDCPRFSGGRYQQAEMQAAATGATIGRTCQLPGYCREW
jgi:endonuclease YncB( thermonuclease family)